MTILLGTSVVIILRTKNANFADNYLNKYVAMVIGEFW
ncbi:hypothetical protein GAPWK_1359 [Gilliamella apicola]|nr:hypothetical protein GAPWK_1359 [Gilliamella apicola]